MRFPFLLRSSRNQKRPPQSVEHFFSIDDQQHSNFSYREAESALLSELGLPTDVRALEGGDLDYLHDCLVAKGRIELPLPTHYLEIARQREYNWRSEPSMRSIGPETALYLDSYVRKNEISRYALREYQREQQERKEYSRIRQKMGVGE